MIDLCTGEDKLVGSGNPYNNRRAASPDGSAVAQWSRVASGKMELAILDLTTWKRRALGEFSVAYPTLSWSPDGGRLAFAAGESFQEHELYLMDVTTGATEQLTDNAFRDDGPAWSPDGAWLVFTSAQDGYNRLHIMNVETHERRLLTAEAFGYSPAWSPDGNLIAFMSNHEAPNGEIYIIAADGTGLRRLTFTNARHVTVNEPAWLPQ
ncbi:MAG: hypothetical protein M5R40_14045 [Anaerolineae bacterium]|nr:hypothetical protein [Anaerolineae bacterium]